jgi:23S rRNA pseudouridine2605 synthase
LKKKTNSGGKQGIGANANSGSNANANSRGKQGNGASGIRLQKVLAQSGVSSRRGSELLISEGRVSVNGTKVDRQGFRVNPAHDVVKVDGKRIYTSTEKKTYAFNKPKGVLSSMKDDRDRICLAGFLPKGESLFHVGRLDYETSGLLLLTNDGDLANKIMHPSFEIEKKYLVTVGKPLSAKVSNALLGKNDIGGVELEDGISKFDKLLKKGAKGNKQLIEVSLHSGKNRIVRRMFDALGYKVLDLVRVSIGSIHLNYPKRIAPGELRLLTQDELNSLSVRARI